MRHKILTAILLILLLPSVSFAAITFQSASAQQSGTTAAFTVSTNTNRYLVVSIMMRSGSSISITYAGVSMTQIGTVGGDGSGTDVNYAFGLIAPATGSNNVVITQNGSLVRWKAAEYDGVDQTTGFEAKNTNSRSTQGALTVTVTPTKSDWIVGCAWIGGGAQTVDGNTTNRGATDSATVIDSNAAKTSAYAIGFSDTGLLSGGELIAFGLIDVSQPVPSPGSTSIWQSLKVYIGNGKFLF